MTPDHDQAVQRVRKDGRFPFIDMAGRQCGALRVVRRSHTDGRGEVCWECECQCGGSVTSRGSMLRDGTVNSCGCLEGEHKSRASLRHGQSRAGKITPEYRSWNLMVSRCQRVRGKDYASYAGRGIRVCERWRGRHGFENFFQDLGSRPSPEHSIDRIDVNGNYEPGNCRWATEAEQQRNRRNNTRLTLGDRSLTMAEWQELTGLSRSAIQCRRRAGWSDERILTTPPRTRAGMIDRPFRSALAGEGGRR